MADENSSANQKAAPTNITAATCPSCGKTVTGLYRIDPGFKLRLQEVGVAPHAAVCQECYNKLGAELSHGAKLHAEVAARDQNRVLVWKNRMALVKEGRNLTNARMLSDAAVSFEKYIRVLEMANNVGVGDLTPDILRKAGGGKELAVVASVYFELLKIYDLSPRMMERAKVASQKLGEFAAAAPGGQALLRQVNLHMKTSRNPDYFQIALDKAQFKPKACFIATAVFSDLDAPEVETLRLFRDQVLLRNRFGVVAIEIYYLISPRIASRLKTHPNLTKRLQPLLRGIASGLRKRFDLHLNH